jgi:alpha-2-macroglobulin-like protein
MFSCESCQSELFPFVYDLLEPAEHEGVEGHLRTCPNCRLALERTKTRAAELASAVRGSFTNVVFKTPRTAPKPKPSYAAPRAPLRPLLLNRWTAAAAVLIAVLSAGGAIALTVTHQQSVELARFDAEMATAQAQFTAVRQEVETKQSAAHKDIRDIQAEIDKLITDWNEKEREHVIDLKDKHVRFEVKGPRSIQAGATNLYAIQVKPVNALQPLKVSHLNVRVVNDKDKTKPPLFEKQFTGAGVSKVVLPPDLAVRPGDDLVLLLEADADGVPTQVREHLTLQFPDYVTYLSTDRPMYRPGETVRFRSLSLERFSLKPAGEELSLRFRIVNANNQEVFKREISTRLTDKGKRVLGPDGQPLHGVGAGEFALPAHIAGGSYTLTVAEINGRFPEEKRTFVVHRWQAPRFSKEAEFNRASYSPGEMVVLTGKVTPLNGQAGMGAGMPGGGGPFGFGNNLQLHAVAVVDGQQIFNNHQQVGGDGSFRIEFMLPGLQGPMSNGVGSVTLIFQDGQDGGNIETLVRPIPIVLRDVLVDFYPEGGDLVAGVPNRVYFQARAGASRPADIQGRILERGGALTKLGKPKPAREIARIHTLTDDKEPGLNQGLGAFTFVPLPDCHYELKLDAPVGVAKAYPLPRAKADGVVLHLPQGVVTTDIPVTLRNAGRQRELLVGAYCRGKLLDSQTVQAPADKKTDLVLRPAANVGGVYRITVFEKQVFPGETRFTPLAERLLFRKQTAQLHVAVRPDKASYAPGESVALSLLASNERKETVPAIAMVAVIDSSLLKLANDKSAHSMPTHFLLTTEIRQPADLENTDALLGDHPRAAQALDLLLGAQGWRRFAEQNPQKFAQIPVIGKPAGFLAAAQSVTKMGVDEQQTRENLDRPFAAKFVALSVAMAQKEREEVGTPDLQQRLLSAQNNAHQAGEQLVEQRRRLDDLWSFFLHGLFGVFAVSIVVFAFFLTVSGLHRLAEGRFGYVFLGGGLLLLGFLFLVSVVGTFAMMGVPEERMHRMFGQRGRGGFKMATPAMVAPRVEQPGQAFDGFGGPPGAGDPMDEDFHAEPDQPNVPAAAPLPGAPLAGGVAPFFPGGMPDRRFQPDDPERQLRALGKYEEILRRRLNRRVVVPPAVETSAVREYAHRYKPAISGPVRRDFTETLCWQPALVLKDGQATLNFDLSDAVSNFRVLVVSHSLDGRLGADAIEIASRLPYSIEPKVPVEVSPSDQIVVPLAIANSTSAPTTATLKWQTKGLAALGDAPAPMLIEPGQTRRHLFHFQPTLTNGKAVVRFQSKFSRGSDSVERSFNVVPDGFPISESFSGTLHDNLPFTHEIVMPESWIAGSLHVQVQAYPSVLADLQKGLDAMLRAPHGCFEQASSSNYPNVLALNYLQDTKQAKPAVEKQARALLDSGYHKLVAFECQPAPNDAVQVKHGYDWFGGAAPPHEALTAYGLMQFHDMARVYPVDPAMLQRTQKYLLDQRDGKGGFKRNARAVDQFGRAPQAITNAYIVWALTETGLRDGLAVELASLYEQGKTSKDPYFIALAGLGQLNAGKTDHGVELLRYLRDFQKDTGEIAGARTSITSSAGRDLLIETTALSALGWLRAARPADFQANAHQAGNWLLAQRDGSGGFGATQSTVLALKALIAFAAGQKATQPGELTMQVVGITTGQARLNPGATDPLTVAFKEKPGDGPNPPNVVLQKGKNVIQLQFLGGNTPLPYTLSCTYRTLQPASSDDAPVRLTTTLTQPAPKKGQPVKFKEGQSVKLKAVLENKSGQDQGMAVAIIGLPAGVILPEDHQQLKELIRPRDNGAKPGIISAWEINGRELVLYWRELKSDARIELDLDVICRLPGTYTGPASRAYLYYNADRKNWVAPLRASIDPAP